MPFFQPYDGYHPSAEIVLGIVCALGTKYGPVLETLGNHLRQFGYETETIKLSEYFSDLLKQLEVELPQKGASVRAEMKWKIEAGNEIRRNTRKDVMALLAASRIAVKREGVEEANPKPLSRRVHIVVTLKRPEEVECLRRIYGAGFYLLGIAVSAEERNSYLQREKGLSVEEANDLVEIDAQEELEDGQQTRETFALSDVFIPLRNHEKEVERFLDLIFGCPFHTPTEDENAMYLAYGAALRSGDLSRQVGASIIDRYGDVLSVGYNEVPKPGGGLYGPGERSYRDMEVGEDTNEIEKFEMAERIVKAIGARFPEVGTDWGQLKKELKAMLKPTGFFDITEFGRPVHAEMEAILACARSGRSTRGAKLFTTTFPCHNCTRHILAAGISKVAYIEPYAKSKAFELHSDAIAGDENVEGRVPFLPFKGVGPRRYMDLFSLSLGSGWSIERKEAWEETTLEEIRGSAAVASATDFVLGPGNTCTRSPKATNIFQGRQLTMLSSTASKLKHQDFWDKMEKAVRAAEQWPSWKRGSAVNKREPQEGKPLERAKAVGSASISYGQVDSD